jgi:hypothetical protein
MNTSALPKTHRFVVLIPHRDAGRLLDEYRAKLFSLGFHGAYSFPPAAPLAVVSGSFSREELRALAFEIREFTRDKDGKIAVSENADSGPAGSTLEQMSFFGPALNLPVTEGLFPETAKGKILSLFSPAVLCAALIGRDEKTSGIEGQPGAGFRAAALANLAIRPIISEKTLPYSYTWKLGQQVWLPSGLRKK